MKTTNLFLGAWLSVGVASALLLTACGGDSNGPNPLPVADAGADAGDAAADAPHDAGPTNDAATPVVDSGNPIVDSGTD